MLNTSPSPAGRGVLAVVALAAAALLLQRCHGWSDEDHLLLPPIVNSSAAAAAANTFLHHRAAADLDLQDLEPVDVDVRYSKRSVVQDQDDSEASAASAASGVSDGGSALLQCNVSVQRLLPTSLVARWDASLGFQCDVLVYTTTTNSHSGGRAFFSASFNRALSPVLVEHLGGVTGGQQELRLCVGGCGLSRYSRRFGRGGSRRQGGGGDAPPPVNFCCVDFSLDELQGDKSWRLNRKPVESTLVACFMTLVIIVWSVAALIWPVPIIAGFLPNGMEQRRPR